MHTLINSLSLSLSLFPPPQDRENRASLPYESFRSLQREYNIGGSARIVSLYFVNPGFERKLTPRLYLYIFGTTKLRDFAQRHRFPLWIFFHRRFSNSLRAVWRELLVERKEGRKEGRKCRLVGSRGARVILDLFISFTQLEFGFAESFL